MRAMRGRALMADTDTEERPDLLSWLPTAGAEYEIHVYRSKKKSRRIDGELIVWQDNVRLLGPLPASEAESLEEDIREFFGGGVYRIKVKDTGTRKIVEQGTLKIPGDPRINETEQPELFDETYNTLPRNDAPEPLSRDDMLEAMRYMAPPPEPAPPRSGSDIVEIVTGVTAALGPFLEAFTQRQDRLAEERRLEAKRRENEAERRHQERLKQMELDAKAELARRKEEAERREAERKDLLQQLSQRERSEADIRKTMAEQMMKALRLQDKIYRQTEAEREKEAIRRDRMLTDVEIEARIKQIKRKLDQEDTAGLVELFKELVPVIGGFLEQYRRAQLPAGQANGNGSQPQDVSESSSGAEEAAQRQEPIQAGFGRRALDAMQLGTAPEVVLANELARGGIVEGAVLGIAKIVERFKDYPNIAGVNVMHELAAHVQDDVREGFLEQLETERGRKWFAGFCRACHESYEFETIEES